MASLLVIEMVNSTSAVELLHPATLSTLLQQYQFYLRQSSRLYRGVVTQLSGDRAMVAFDVRQCQDEHAFNAICCGQLFLHLMQRLAVMQSGRNAQQLEFRLAVHSGDVFFSPLWKSPKQDKDSSRRETVIGHTVYTSSFKTRDAIGIDVRSHRKTFQLRQAGYTPMVSDGRRLYLIGYYELIGLQPARR